MSRRNREHVRACLPAPVFVHSCCRPPAWIPLSLCKLTAAAKSQ